MDRAENRRDGLIVLSGPSGSGKSTLVERVLATGDLLVHKSVSATTRPPRPNETDGVHYHFWTDAEFEEGVRDGRFVEWAEVFGNRYGTLHSEVDQYLQQGMCVLLEIDVQGAMQVRRQCPDCVLVFVKASSAEEYGKRIKRRANESGADLQRRIEAAERELGQASLYDHVIINDDLEKAIRAFRTILQQCGGDRRVG
jgi:guanylate kinase